MKKRMYELAKTRRGLKKEKAHKRSVYGLSGVPGATRTPGLPLRRRSLCPTELREHGLWGVALGECTSSALGGGRSILLGDWDVWYKNSTSSLSSEPFSHVKLPFGKFNLSVSL